MYISFGEKPSFGEGMAWLLLLLLLLLPCTLASCTYVGREGTMGKERGCSEVFLREERVLV